MFLHELKWIDYRFPDHVYVSFTANETFEKLASMSLIANMTVYLKTKYNMDGILVVNVINIWSGCSNITSIAGALVSDTFLGRFVTLLFGSFSSLLVNQYAFPNSTI